MAKKASYLTELIERHEKWKAETGGKRDDRDDHKSRANEQWVVVNWLIIQPYVIYRDDFEDQEDLWDFGTVRHVTGGQSTIGRAGPTENGLNNNLTYPARHEPSDSSSSSGGGSTVYAHGVNGHSSSSTAKLELPPTPNHARSGPSPTSPTAGDVHKALPINPRVSSEDDGTGTVRGGRRDPSYGSDDSEEELRAHMQRASLSSPIPPTMLDSVVLPAIASVRKSVCCGSSDIMSDEIA